MVAIKSSNQKGDKLARSNYQYKKRQKELARKKKKEQKRQLKFNKNITTPEDDTSASQEVELTPPAQNSDKD